MTFLENIIKEKKIETEKMTVETVEPLRETSSFVERVRATPHHVHLIGEIKRASPSKGQINMEIDVQKQAKLYEEAGVSAISVLTDEVFFKGSFDVLAEVASTVKLPVLCKDFIISRKQLIKARNAGATMVLLIVAALSEDQLKELFTQAVELGLEVLVEVHNEEELRKAEALGASLIGVNNRDLHTFEVSLETSVQLGKKQETQAVYISESGFRSKEDVAKVKENYRAVLVGETLMTALSPADKVRELQVRR